MNSLRWCWLFGSLGCCASTLAQGILIPLASYPVQNAPFSLTIEKHWESKNGDGRKEGTQLLMRDSAGRQRYEPPIIDGVPMSPTVVIFDVVEGKSIKLDLKARVALVAKLPVGRAIDLSTANCQPPPKLKEGQTPLGTKEIAGLEAWGEVTLKTGTLSSGSSVTEEREVWHSTRYCMQLAEIIRRDQRATTQSVSNFSSDEPAPSLFQIPPDFTVRDAPPNTRPEPAPGTVRIRGDVSAPIVLNAPDPEFSDQARRANVNGGVLVHLIVDEKELPQDVRVIRGLGYGLDEKAIEAVRKYRFRPAMRQGLPVKVEMNVQINFQVFGKP